MRHGHASYSNISEMYMQSPIAQAVPQHAYIRMRRSSDCTFLWLAAWNMKPLSHNYINRYNSIIYYPFLSRFVLYCISYASPCIFDMYTIPTECYGFVRCGNVCIRLYVCREMSLQTNVWTYSRQFLHSYACHKERVGTPVFNEIVNVSDLYFQGQ